MFIEVDGARLFFDSVGSQLAIGEAAMVARPTLIVMHGGPGFDHSGMRPYFDRFADTHQVIYIDHRGNGRSTGAPESWTLEQWGKDVKALCDALGIEKPHVYGNSFGGMVAMSYAAQFPDHPAKLILSSTAARLQLDVTYKLMEARGGAEARAVAEKFWTDPDAQVMDDYIRICMPFYNPKPNPAEIAARKRALLRPEVSRHFILGEMRTMNMRGGLSNIVCPTLILAGGYDPITPVPCSEEIADLIPSCAAGAVRGGRPRRPPRRTGACGKGDARLPRIGAGVSGPAAALAHPETGRPLKRHVSAVIVGNALEFYDFLTYAYFAIFIGQTFFPSANPTSSLLLSLATFGAGFITRPVGAVVIGLIGDGWGASRPCSCPSR